MKFQVLKSCVINGAPKKAGDVVDIASDADVRALMGIGRIAPYDEPLIEDRSIGLSEETKPKKRGRPKKVID